MIPIYTIDDGRKVFVHIRDKTCIVHNQSKSFTKYLGKGLCVDKPYVYWLWVDCRECTAKQARTRLDAARKLIRRILTNSREVVASNGREQVCVKVRVPYLSIVVEDTPELIEAHKAVKEHTAEKLSKLNDEYITTEFQRRREFNPPDITDETIMQHIKYDVKQQKMKIKGRADELCKTVSSSFKPPGSEPIVEDVPVTKYKQDDNLRTTSKPQPKEEPANPTLPEWLTPEVIKALDKARFCTNLPPDEPDEDDFGDEPDSFDKADFTNLAKDLVKIIVGTVKNNEGWKRETMALCDRVDDVVLWKEE